MPGTFAKAQAADQSVLDQQTRAQLSQTLTMLNQVLEQIGTEVKAKQYSETDRAQLSGTLGSLSTTLRTLDTVIAGSDTTGTNIAITSPKPTSGTARVSRAEQPTAEVQPSENQTESEQPIVTQEESQGQTASVSENARKVLTSWNFWLVLLLIAIAIVIAIVLRRRTPGEEMNLGASKTNESKS